MVEGIMMDSEWDQFFYLFFIFLYSFILLLLNVYVY